ncbi:MAG: MFS transporter [Sorangiineae bacterium]|nr:MFS transporter [Sorangiineae bacterium]
MVPSLVKPISLLFIALFNSILGLSVLFPILAPLGRELGFTELQVGMFSTAYALMQFLISPYWGRKSERIGRKPVMLTGILGFAITFFLFAVAAELGMRGVLPRLTVFALMLVARLLGGTFSSATLPTAQAYVADVTGRADRTSGMAVIGAAFGLGVIFGPGIGAALSHVSLLAPVYFSSAVALLNALFVWWKLPEPKSHVEAREPTPLSLRDARVWPLLAVGLVATLASVAMEQTIAFYFQDRLHLDAAHTPRPVGEALVAYGLVAVFVQGYLIRRFKWPPLVLLKSGIPIALAGFVAFVFAKGFTGLTIALVLQGLGQGLAMPGVTAALSLAVGDDEQGAVAGLNSSSQAFGRMLGPLVGTGLYELHPEYPYALSAALLAMVLVFLFASRRVREAVRS